CAVDKGFELDRGLRVDLADFVDRELAGQHDALNSQLGGNADAFGAGERHLRGGVNGKIGADGADQSHEAEILDQDGVDARFGEAYDGTFDGFQLRREDERVERDVAADAAAVEVTYHLGQVVQMEIGGTGPGVETRFETKVNRVGAVFDGSRDAQ